jgi:flagellar protein FlbD
VFEVLRRLPDMIKLTRLNGSQFILNADLIEQIQATPDTVIILTNGRNYMVLEDSDEVVRRVVSFRRRVFGSVFAKTAPDDAPEVLRA